MTYEKRFPIHPNDELACCHKWTYNPYIHECCGSELKDLGTCWTVMDLRTGWIRPTGPEIQTVVLKIFKTCFLLFQLLYFDFLINLFELMYHFFNFLVENCCIKSNRERNYSPKTTQNRSRAGLKSDYDDKESCSLRDDTKAQLLRLYQTWNANQWNKMQLRCSVEGFRDISYSQVRKFARRFLAWNWSYSMVILKQCFTMMMKFHTKYIFSVKPLLYLLIIINNTCFKLIVNSWWDDRIMYSCQVSIEGAQKTQ